MSINSKNMSYRTLRVLIVDDSAFMRLILKDMLSQTSDMEVIGAANNGKEAVEMTHAMHPDAIIMDMEMGEFDGLYAVQRIMADKPTPILILSAVGNVNLEPIFEALKWGAVDYMNKPSRSNSKVRSLDKELIEKIRQVAGADPKKSISLPEGNSVLSETSKNLEYDVIGIGASTGGPAAIEQIITKLPADLGIPIVICQHMPHNFIAPFVKRLNNLSSVKVVLGWKGMTLEQGVAIVAPGDANLQVERSSNGEKSIIGFNKKVFPDYNNPSINAMMSSLANVYKNKALGILLTGMGKDGAAGLKKIFDAGGYTIAQDKGSSVIYGMPKVAIEMGGVSEVLDIKEIGNYLIRKL